MVSIRIITFVAASLLSQFCFAEDDRYPGFLPDSIERKSKLLELANKYGFIDIQEIKITDNVQVVGIFEPWGSGIVTVKAYIYTCEPSACRLFTFLRSLEKKLFVNLDYSRKELQLKSASGEIVLVTHFPWNSENTR